MELSKLARAARSAATERVELTDGMLDRWARDYLPGLDVFYADRKAFDTSMRGALVFERKAYTEHPTFQQIEYVNTYQQWNLRSETRWVIVANPGWISQQPESSRSRLLEAQIRLQRGLVFPVSRFDPLPEVVRPMVVGDQVVLTHATWDGLTPGERRAFLRSEQTAWDDLYCFPVPPETRADIAAMANQFIEIDGPNCVAVTAQCATGEAWLGQLWLNDGEFHDRLGREGYGIVDGTNDPAPGDVVIFRKSIYFQHAAYCLAPDRLLTKNGQSRFNPIRVVDMRMLRNDWRNSSLDVLRKGMPE